MEQVFKLMCSASAFHRLGLCHHDQRGCCCMCRRWQHSMHPVVSVSGR
jgi:hypothetical protein